jgi:hypothetical protein
MGGVRLPWALGFIHADFCCQYTLVSNPNCNALVDCTCISVFSATGFEHFRQSRQYAVFEASQALLSGPKISIRLLICVMKSVTYHPHGQRLVISG